MVVVAPLITKPSYCRECGQKLIDTQLVSGYNMYNGKQEIHRYLSCPQLIDSHDKWIQEFIRFDDTRGVA